MLLSYTFKKFLCFAFKNTNSLWSNNSLLSDFRSSPKTKFQTNCEYVRVKIHHFDLSSTMPKILIDRHDVPIFNVVSQNAIKSSVERWASINIHNHCSHYKILFIIIHTYIYLNTSELTRIPRRITMIHHNALFRILFTMKS